MPRTRRPRTPLIAAAVLTALLSGCGSSDSPVVSSEVTASTEATPSHGPVAAGPHNAQDVTFLQEMLPHHQQAVEMSELALGRDTETAVQDLATQIKAAQGPEIAQMAGWLTGWGEIVPDEMAGHDMGGTAMNGMLTDTELTALDDADGAEFAELFLRGMRQHHQGAVAMAKAELASGQNAEAKALATRIISAQQSEIATMEKLLAA